MKTHELFPSFVHVGSLNAKKAQRLNKDILDESYKIKDTDIGGQKWSAKNYPGGYTSYSSMNELHRFSTTFMDLKKEIDQQVQHYIKTLELDIPAKQIQMTSLWLNIMPPQVVHTMHIHPLSVISGTYYVSVPPKASSIKFEDPRHVAFMASPPRKAKAGVKNQRFVSFNPEAGQVILFESWMRHEVSPNQSKKDRISVSFNYDWIRA